MSPRTDFNQRAKAFKCATASNAPQRSEFLDRCLVLTVDEERAQTKAIHEKQKEKQTLEGLLARRDKDAILKLHRNAQRLLRPLAVVNPYARQPSLSMRCVPVDERLIAVPIA